MPKNQHIKVVEDGGRVSLICDDYELFDWMDDLFTEEHDIDVDGIIYDESTSGGKTVFRIIFPRSVSVDLVREAVDDLDNAEIERVWLLNNTYAD